jgi:hypothetical protein
MLLIIIIAVSELLFFNDKWAMFSYFMVLAHWNNCPLFGPVAQLEHINMIPNQLVISLTI